MKCSLAPSNVFAILLAALSGIPSTTGLAGWDDTPFDRGDDNTTTYYAVL